MKIELIYYSNTRKPDLFLGTPGESIPRFQISLNRILIEKEELETTKIKITTEHKENMKSMPESWQKNLPEPKWLIEREIEIDYSI